MRHELWGGNTPGAKGSFDKWHPKQSGLESTLLGADIRAQGDKCIGNIFYMSFLSMHCRQITKTSIFLKISG